MPLKSNPNSKGPASGIRALHGPLGIHSKKETWANINKMLEATWPVMGRVFSDEEQAAVRAQNNGLNAYQLAKIFRKIKRQYMARTALKSRFF